MVEPALAPASNARSNASTFPPLPSVSSDEDDEPPSSRPYQSGHPQVTNDSAGENGISAAAVTDLEAEDARFPPVKKRDTLYISNSNETRVARGSDDGGALVRADTFTTLDAEKQEGRSVSEEGPRGRWASIKNRFRLSKTSRVRALFTPAHDIGPRPTYLQSLKATARYTPLNILLLAIPVSWALHWTHQSPTMVFVFSCLAIIPLAALLGLGTEQIALHTSQSVGGLLNATLGNVVEMIIAGIALKQCELELVQSSLLGGLLSNLLLVLGCAFIVGGFKFQQQEFQPMVAQLNSSLLILSVISLIIPVAFHLYLEDKLAPGTEVDVLLKLSRGSAILLFLIYFAYLFFQFYSHNHLFLDTHQSKPARRRTTSSSSSESNDMPTFSRSSTKSETLRNGPTSTLASVSSLSLEDQQDGHHEVLKLNIPFSLVLLGAVTALAYITAEHLVDSLEGLVRDHPSISKEWITLIIIPVISNAAEHATAVVVARKGKFDLAMSVAVGSCIQIALLVIPLLVLVAWGMDKPLMLLFDPLETIVSSSC
ncbi:calcium ion transporter [Coprinopsis cinerea AmutBmut pab1-1]|nr:calcium ion transporter [Coprinopsis cinerea AmutBmut pab1-1]